MSVNIKPINEVPVVEEVTAGDRVLVNRSGAAVQVPANALGGGSGGGGGAAGGAAGGAVYVDLQSTMGEEGGEAIVQAFTDIEMTTPMDYETGKTILLGAGKLSQDFSAVTPGAVAYFTPTGVMDIEEAKLMQAMVSLDGTGFSFVIVFSDSIGL